MADAIAPETLGAVVVNHEAGDALSGCVASLRAAGVTTIVVVDNASGDGSLVRLAELDALVELLPTGQNLGYGTAVNRGVALIDAEFVLVCNPDVVLDPSAPRRLVETLQADPGIGIVGPAIFNPDGSRYPSSRAVPSLADAAGHALVGLFQPSNPWSARYRGDGVDRSVPSDADWLSGACFMTRRLAFDSVGGFDEGYFMYVEDLDLCWRLRQAGWRVRYEPSAEVVHVQGVSARHHPYKMLVAHHRSTLRFARRSSHGVGRFLVPFTAALLGARLVIALVKEFGRRERPSGTS